MSEYREQLEELRREDQAYINPKGMSAAEAQRRNPVLCEFTFRVEMNVGQDIRVVEADCYSQTDQWLIFYRKPPQGGKQEYWRVRMDNVVSISTVRQAK